MQSFRIIVVSGIAGWLCWYLGQVVVKGVRTGAIHHTNSTKVCRKKDNPAGFWALVILFSSLIALFVWAWGFAIINAVKKLF